MNVDVVEVGSTDFDGMIVNPVLLVWHTHWINFGHFHNEVRVIIPSTSTVSLSITLTLSFNHSPFHIHCLASSHYM